MKTFLRLFSFTLAVTSSGFTVCAQSRTIPSAIGPLILAVHQDFTKDNQPYFLSISTAEGRLLKRADFSVDGRLSSALRFKTLSILGLPYPLILAVAASQGGSDSHFETTLIGMVNGAIYDLFDRHLETNILDAICIMHYGTTKKPAVIHLKFLWENEAHYQPHRYEVTRYDWSDLSFKKAISRQTRKKYGYWYEAAREMGYSCRYDLVKPLTEEFR